MTTTRSTSRDQRLCSLPSSRSGACSEGIVRYFVEAELKSMWGGCTDCGAVLCASVNFTPHGNSCYFFPFSISLGSFYRLATVARRIYPSKAHTTPHLLRRLRLVTSKVYLYT